MGRAVGLVAGDVPEEILRPLVVSEDAVHLDLTAAAPLDGGDDHPALGKAGQVEGLEGDEAELLLGVQDSDVAALRGLGENQDGVDVDIVRSGDVGKGGFVLRRGRGLVQGLAFKYVDHGLMLLFYFQSATAALPFAW